jgi:hypothetical protein
MIERVFMLLILAGVVALLLVAGRAVIAAKRRRALAAEPLASAATGDEAGRVRLLAFSTPHCQQCHLLQKPALEDVVGRNSAVEIVPIDALEQPELAARYGILTVPSTVVLTADGRAAAVNYGYAPAKVLLEQIGAAQPSLAAHQAG